MFAALHECYPLRSLFYHHNVRTGYRTLSNMKHQVAFHNSKKMKEYNDNILCEQLNLPPPAPEPRRTRAQAAAAAADLIPDVLMPTAAPPPGPVVINPRWRRPGPEPRAFPASAASSALPMLAASSAMPWPLITSLSHRMKKSSLKKSLYSDGY